MKKGDIVYLEYEGRVKETEELFDTTKEKLAKDAEIHDEKKKYKPIPVIVGETRVLKGLDKALLSSEVGKVKTTEIPPKEAYGPRDPGKVEILSLRELRRRDITPEVGREVMIKGRVGRITRVTAGRVMVDFNHQLAGKTLVYKYKIIKRAKTKREKTEAILEMYYPDDFKIIVEKDDASITIPDACKYDKKWFLAKYKVAKDLRDFVGFKRVRFIEGYVEKVEKKRKKEIKKGKS